MLSAAASQRKAQRRVHLHPRTEDCLRESACCSALAAARTGTIAKDGLWPRPGLGESEKGADGKSGSPVRTPWLQDAPTTAGTDPRYSLRNPSSGIWRSSSFKPGALPTEAWTRVLRVSRGCSAAVLAPLASAPATAALISARPEMPATCAEGRPDARGGSGRRPDGDAV